MPIRQLRNALRLLGSGVPRLWRAARSAGASRADAVDVVVASLLAFVLSARGGGVGWRQQNAVRHFTWQAYLAARHGEPLARAVGEAQESGSADPDDSRVDEENNRAGRAHGVAHAGELAGGRRATLTALVEVARRKWRRRELSAQSLPDGSDPREA